MSFKRRVMILEADAISEKKSLNLMRPSMLCPTTVIIPAMLAAAATTSIARLSLPLLSIREHDDILACQMKKDKALLMRDIHEEYKEYREYRVYIHIYIYI